MKKIQMLQNYLPYTEIPHTMIEAEFLTANEFRVCAVLHSLNYLVHLFPSLEELTEKTNLKRDAVINAISHLEEEGIIVKCDQRTTKAGRFSTNEYKFVCGCWNSWYQKRFGESDGEDMITGRKILESDIPKNDNTLIEVIENKLPYVRIFNNFLYSNKINSNEVRVFLFLKKFANCRDIYPSYATLCKKTGLSKPTIIKTITELSDKGLVVKVEVMHDDGGKGANRYLIKNDDELIDWLNS